MSSENAYSTTKTRGRCSSRKFLECCTTETEVMSWFLTGDEIWVHH